MAENLITPTELEDFAPDLDLSGFAGSSLGLVPTISGMISRASTRVLRYCEIDGFILSAVTNERDKVAIDPMGNLIISFRRRPATTVSAIRLRTVDVNQALTLSSDAGNHYWLNAEGTVLTYPSNFLISHGRGLFTLDNSNLYYEIDYTGGYATVPDDVKEAVTLMVRDIAQRKLNPGGVQSFSQGSLSINYGADNESQFVKEAKRILNDGGYRRMVI